MFQSKNEDTDDNGVDHAFKEMQQELSLVMQPELNEYDIAEAKKCAYIAFAQCPTITAEKPRIRIKTKEFKDAVLNAKEECLRSLEEMTYDDISAKKL